MGEPESRFFVGEAYVYVAGLLSHGELASYSCGASLVAQPR
jgi:hypothetical protein